MHPNYPVHRLLTPLCILWLAGWLTVAGGEEKIPHLQKQGTATRLIVEDKPWTILGGELHNSTASNLDYISPRWEKLSALHLNTVLATLSWELVEPEEGKFDFTLVDGLIQQARQHHMKLVFLWFGSWKNAVSSYVPGWVKTNLDRFPRAQTRKGVNLEVLSSLSPECCAADAKAFAAVMRHIRQIDARQQTVVMMQVENEVGLRNDSRDRSPLAEAAFSQPVPAALTEYLQKHKENLNAEFKAIWEATGFKTSGNWTDVFGEGADELFMAWHVAHYVGQVAKAGQAEYPLPMYANAWLIGDPKQKPGDYPSGGPVSRVMDIWRVAAPAIALQAPDIYVGDFKGVCASYTRQENPLFIPEINRHDPMLAGNVFYAIGQHSAIGYCPFGIDNTDIEQTHPLGKSYKLLSELMPLITKYKGTGQMAGILEDKETEETIALGDYHPHVYFKFHEKGNTRGYGLIICVAPNEYIAAGTGFMLGFGSKPGNRPITRILSIDEGRFVDGKWIAGRRMNGDENGGGARAFFPGPELSLLRIKLYDHR